MISVQEALEKIVLTLQTLGSVSVTVENGVGFVLAEDVNAPIDMPPFDQSAMDGYAVNMTEGDTYCLVGEIKTGDKSEYNLKPGQAVRIFTGAMVPTGANTVVKQEIVSKSDDSIRVNESIAIGQNIRPTGEQIQKDEKALKKGTYLNPGAIGYIATLGLANINVHRKPIITLIVTGNELIKPGIPLKTGKIYESNSYTLQAALSNSGFASKISTVLDDYDSTFRIIDDAISSSDVVIITGGISVGDYDFVGDALVDLNVTTDFYKVKQKPGKPLFFGHKEDKIIFALPGNPAAMLTCFYVYVLPSLNTMMGKSDSFVEAKELELKDPYKKTATMTHFLKAFAKDGRVQILGSQSSAMLSSFIDSNCLLKLEQGREEWKIGDQVAVIMLP